MRIYKVYQHDPDAGCLLDWFEFRRDARKHLDLMKSDVAPYGIEAVEIECTRAGVIRWLNRHFISENGHDKKEVARLAQLQRDATAGSRFLSR